MKGINLDVRIKRLNELTMNLSCERLAFRDDIFPLHHVERNEYLAAIIRPPGAPGPDCFV